MTPKDILKQAMALQDSKGEDYCDDVNADQFQNFNRAAFIVSWFKNPRDQVFACMIAIKLARLAVLLNKADADPKSKPNNESIKDSFLDGTNYFALWGGRRLKK